MTTTQSTEARRTATENQIRDFLQTPAAQEIMRIGFCNIKELYVVRELGCTRREARAALKLTGRW